MGRSVLYAGRVRRSLSFRGHFTRSRRLPRGRAVGAARTDAACARALSAAGAWGPNTLKRSSTAASSTSRSHHPTTIHPRSRTTIAPMSRVSIIVLPHLCWSDCSASRRRHDDRNAAVSRDRLHVPISVSKGKTKRGRLDGTRPLDRRNAAGLPRETLDVARSRNHLFRAARTLATRATPGGIACFEGHG
jgi:hypothetical protein